VSNRRQPIVKIGCSLVLSGDRDEAAHCRHLQQAMELAVDQANRREDLPLQVELDVADDRMDPDRAVAVAETFAADEWVLGVVGTANSHTSLAAAPVYYRAGLVQISPSASNVDITRKGYKTFFRLAPHDGWQGTDAARYAVSILGARQIAVIHDNTSFGEPLARIFRQTAEEFGIKVAPFIGIERGQVDFRAVVEEIQDADPDLIFFGLIEAEGRLLAPRIREAGVRALYFGADGLKPSRFLATPGYDVPGPYHTNAGTNVWLKPSARDFVRAYTARYGEAYSIYTAEAYDAVNILIDAFTRAQTLDRPSIREAVARARGFPGASGCITFDERGDIRDPKIGIYRLEGKCMVFLGYSHDLLGQVELPSGSGA
jgi:branched-chain amino acid transport system substrate-binding protein